MKDQKKDLDVYGDEYYARLEGLPADDREAVLMQDLKFVGEPMSSFELAAILRERDIDKLKGKIDE